jgi:glycosyltransferase involved in cell wall biosynthesis
LKGLTYLIEAVAKLRTERGVELVVVGKERVRSAARRAVERFGLEDSVSFVTGVQTLRLVELYTQSEVAVVPSLYEGFSLPAIEAMSCGVPVVATSAGSLPEVIGRDSEAALVPPADADALAFAIRRFLDDAELRARAGRAGRARVQRLFTWRQTARSVVDEYGRVPSAC